MMMPTVPERRFRHMVVAEDQVILPQTSTIITTGGPSPMPTFDEWFRGFTYKPGYALTLIHGAPVQGLHLFRYSPLHLRCYLPDSTRAPHEPFLIQFQATVPHDLEGTNREYQVRYLRNILQEFEYHEIDEWFRINGELVHNPHG